MKRWDEEPEKDTIWTQAVIYLIFLLGRKFGGLGIETIWPGAVISWSKVKLRLTADSSYVFVTQASQRY